MKKILAFFVCLCLLCCSFVNVSAAEISEKDNSGKTVFTTTVPDKHKITAKADGADVFVEGTSSDDFSVDRQSEPRILIRPDSNRKVTKVLLNGEDVTEKLDGGYLPIGKIFKDSELVVETTEVEQPKEQIKFTVKGSVTHNGQPVVGATVEIRSTLKTTVTDSKGTFTFTDVSNEKHTLTVLDSTGVLGYLEFEVDLGNVESYKKLADGSYLVTIPTASKSASFDFVINDEDKIEITKLETSNKKQPEGSKDTNAPQTGDNSNMALWIFLLCISGAALTVTTLYGRKKKEVK